LWRVAAQRRTVGSGRRSSRLAGISPDGETRTRTGDTTIFRESRFCGSVPQQPCKSPIPTSGDRGAMPYVWAGFPRVWDSASVSKSQSVCSDQRLAGQPSGATCEPKQFPADPPSVSCPTRGLADDLWRTPRSMLACTRLRSLNGGAPSRSGPRRRRRYASIATGETTVERTPRDAPDLVRTAHQLRGRAGPRNYVRIKRAFETASRTRSPNGRACASPRRVDRCSPVELELQTRTHDGAEVIGGTARRA
jgi:hypothetical protein